MECPSRPRRRCLDRRRPPFSPWTAFILLVSCLTAPLSALGQESGGMAGMLSPKIGLPGSAITLGYQHSPQADLTGSASDLGWQGHHVSFRTPLLQNHVQELSATARVALTELDTTAVLPDSRLRLPDRLWDIGLGASYRRQLDGGMIAGLIAEAASPSDKPFNSGDEVSLNATAFLRLPNGENDAWLFFLNYDRNREFLHGLPIPGAAYWLAPSPGFQALLGVPYVTLRWRPVPAWEATAFYLMPYRLRAKLSYRLSERLRPYLSLDWSSRRWFLTDRAHVENRLFLWEKRVALGVASPLGGGVLLDVSLGWAFDRLMFQGENWGDRHQDRLDLEDGIFVSASLGYRF